MNPDTNEQKKETAVKQEVIHSRPERRKDFRREVSYGAVIWAIFLIFVGFVFLLNNLGVLPWDIWGNLWRFWPLSLVLIGLHIILGRSRLAAILTAIITLVVCVAVVTFSALFTIDSSRWNINIDSDWFRSLEQRFNFNTEQVKETLVVEEDKFSNIKTRNLSIDLGSSSFSLEDASSLDYLKLDATYYKDYGKPVLESSEANGELDINFSTETSRMMGFMMGGTRNYDLTLGQTSIPTSLRVDLGSGSGDINLDSVELDSFNLDVSSGTLKVKLADESLPKNDSTLNVSSGSLNLDLPSNVGLRVRYDISSGSLSVNGRSLRRSGVYTSDNVSTSTTVLDLDVKVSSGSVVVE